MQLLQNRDTAPIFAVLLKTWSFSSVGLERRLDRAEVTGSNPVMTTPRKDHGVLPFFGESQ